MSKTCLIEQHCGYASKPTIMRLMPNGDLVELVIQDPHKKCVKAAHRDVGIFSIQGQ